jgi:hypothetical protein
MSGKTTKGDIKMPIEFQFGLLVIGPMVAGFVIFYIAARRGLL